MKTDKQNSNRILHYIGKAFNILLIIIVIINVYAIALKLITKKDTVTVLGITTAIVDTGSMEGDEPDSISAQSMVVLIKAPEYRIGDVIMFQGNLKTPITHRIVGIDENGFVTKGDANNSEDSDRVNESQIYGKLLFKIPGVGEYVKKLRTPLGSLIVVLFCFLLIAGPMFFNREEESADSASPESREPQSHDTPSN